MLKILSKPRTKRIHIGPKDDGRRMSLDQFDEAVAQESQRQQLTAMARWRGQWQTRAYKMSQRFTTSLLPGFTLDLNRVFAAAK